MDKIFTKKLRSGLEYQTEDRKEEIEEERKTEDRQEGDYRQEPGSLEEDRTVNPSPPIVDPTYQTSSIPSEMATGGQQTPPPQHPAAQQNSKVPQYTLPQHAASLQSATLNQPAVPPGFVPISNSQHVNNYQQFAQPGYNAASFGPNNISYIVQNEDTLVPTFDGKDANYTLPIFLEPLRNYSYLVVSQVTAKG